MALACCLILAILARVKSCGGYAATSSPGWLLQKFIHVLPAGDWESWFFSVLQALPAILARPQPLGWTRAITVMSLSIPRLRKPQFGHGTRQHLNLGSVNSRMDEENILNSLFHTVMISIL